MGVVKEEALRDAFKSAVDRLFAAALTNMIDGTKNEKDAVSRLVSNVALAEHLHDEALERLK